MSYPIGMQDNDTINPRFHIVFSLFYQKAPTVEPRLKVFYGDIDKMLSMKKILQQFELTERCKMRNVFQAF